MSLNSREENEMLKSHPERDLLDRIIIHNSMAHPWAEIVPKEDIPFEIVEKVAFPKHAMSGDYSWFRGMELVVGPKKEIEKEAERLFLEKLEKVKQRFGDVIEEFRLLRTEDYEFLGSKEINSEDVDVFIFKNRILFTWEAFEVNYNIRTKMFGKVKNFHADSLVNFQKNKDMLRAVRNALADVSLYSMKKRLEIAFEVSTENYPFAVFVQLDFLNCMFEYRICESTYVNDIKNMYVSLRINQEDIIAIKMLS